MTRHPSMTTTPAQSFPLIVPRVDAVSARPTVVVAPIPLPQPSPNDDTNNRRVAVDVDDRGSYAGDINERLASLRRAKATAVAPTQRRLVPVKTLRRRTSTADAPRATQQLQDVVDVSLDDEKRIYGASLRPKAKSSREKMPSDRRGHARRPEVRRLHPLEQLQRERDIVTKQVNVMSKALQRQVDDGASAVPLDFLLERHHIEVAERVVLRSMCRVLRTQHRRALAAAFFRWNKRTLVLRLLEDDARQRFLTRQTSLAHACAIIQRKIQLRMRKLLTHWRWAAAMSRWIEDNARAMRIQRLWKIRRIQIRIRSLALTYRAQVRNQSAVVIQSLVRQFLSRQLFSRLLVAHKRHVAASLIQRSYRNVVVCRLARRHLHCLAATVLQRCWRGFRGRLDATARRQSCREACELIYWNNWRPKSLSIVLRQHVMASKIQRCFQAFRFSRKIYWGIQQAYTRRHFFPASVIQKAWRQYRKVTLQSVLDGLVFRVAMTHLTAARRIQAYFREYIRKRRELAAAMLAVLFRGFECRRRAIPRILGWMIQWYACRLYRWHRNVGPNSRWHSTLTDAVDTIYHFRAAQGSPVHRLNVRDGFRRIMYCKNVESQYLSGRASQIIRCWRYHRLWQHIARLKLATQTLQRSLWTIFVSYKRRQHRRRVLSRWKRQRYLQMRHRFDHWKIQYALAREANDLTTTKRNVRKSRWFRHQKLRKRFFHHWKRLLAGKRYAKTRLELACSHSAKKIKQRHLLAWLSEAHPWISCSNRLSELKNTLVVWDEWRAFVLRKRKTNRARNHFGHVAKRCHFRLWKRDLHSFRMLQQQAVQHHTQRLMKASFQAYRLYVTKMRKVDEFRRRHQVTSGLRRIVLHVSLIHQSREYNQRSDQFRRRHLLARHYAHWRHYIVEQSDQQTLLANMEARYNRQISKKAIAKWVERTPMARDYRFIRELSDKFYAMKLCERVFKCGFVSFWTLTVGARKTAMAIRVQRMYRSRRARLRLFALRMKIQYQLAARVALGLDSHQYTFETLLNALKTQLWTFVLISLPWEPVNKDTRIAFLKTATSLSYIRKLPFEFGEADATELAPSSYLNYPGDLDPSHACDLTLASWLGLEQHQLPCIVACWHGIHSMDAPSSRTIKPHSTKHYWTLSRRFRRICAGNATPSMRLLISADASDAGKMTGIINWIETLIRSSRDAAAIDLQACVRKFLAIRKLKRMLAIRRVRQSQRICQWVVQLKTKWRNAKEYASSVKIQRWIRCVWKRREFWCQLRCEMKRHRNAAAGIQRVVRRRSVRKRFQVALSSLLSTPIRYPNAPLCESCIGMHPENPLLSLARLRCRGCEELYCASCFWKTHKSAKRMRHVCDAIDIESMNSPSTVMCALCEVQGALRQCWSCQPSGELMCLSCFELKHTDREWNRNILWQKGEERVKAWWESSAFQTHQWVRIDRSAASIQAPTMMTSQEVKCKHKWTNLEDIKRQRETQESSEQLQREREERLLAVRLQHESILRDAFERYDTDKSGSIDRTEFKRMFREELCQPLTDGQVDEAFRVMDKSGNGLVEFDELLAWFSEDVLNKNTTSSSKDTPSLSLLKEALKAKKKMRRYKDKLNEFLPSIPNGKHESGEVVIPSRPKVPGFPAVECIEHVDFAKKRRVFMRFLQEVCGLSWVVEDETVIPVANAMEIFDRVFLPRWNAGQLTYDFYFDDESFEFDGEFWTRRWNTATKKYEFWTTRVKKRALNPDETNNKKRRRGLRRSISETTSLSTVPSEREFTEESVEIVETIDPRRKQMLLDDAMRAFKKADTDSSGYIDTAEFHRMLNTELCEPVSKAKARQVMKQLDADGSGKIDFHEFFQWYAVEKCQDYPVTPQMERARALLRTRRRVQATALAAVEKSVSGGLKLKAVINERRKARRFAQDCKGASHELIELLQEGFDKALAQKALSLHDQDVNFARQWLQNREEQIRHERETNARERADRKAQRRRDAKDRAVKRRQKLAAARKHIKLLLFGPSKKEAHAARLEQALVNLDREVRMVERQLTMRTKRLNGAT